jgi:hypothetical protein
MSKVGVVTTKSNPGLANTHQASSDKDQSRSETVTPTPRG